MASKPTKTPDPTSLSEPAGPIGRKIEPAIGPGSLRPGAGKIVQRSGNPLYCGAIVGRAFGYMTHPNAKDPKRESTRFAGSFMGITHNGTIKHTQEAYLPSAIERTIKSALDLQEGTGLKSPVSFSIEVWCDPDPRESSSMGFRYTCYDRSPQAENDPLLALAVQSGLIEAPQRALPPAPERPENVDPETGEITS